MNFHFSSAGTPSRSSMNTSPKPPTLYSLPSLPTGCGGQTCDAPSASESEQSTVRALPRRARCCCPSCRCRAGTRQSRGSAERTTARLLATVAQHCRLSQAAVASTRGQSTLTVGGDPHAKLDRRERICRRRLRQPAHARLSQTTHQSLFRSPHDGIAFNKPPRCESPRLTRSSAAACPESPCNSSQHYPAGTR